MDGVAIILEVCRSRATQVLT